MSVRRWQGRVALVTGASAGIGAAVARALAGAGLRVAVCARRVEVLETMAAEFPEGSVLPLQVDLRDTAQIVAMFDRIRGQWGGVDVLVNNAGLGFDAPLMTGETERWREMLEVNVLALCTCTREAIIDMRARGTDGHVLHINSMSGHRIPKRSGVYGATKYAVTSLTEGLRQELHEAGLPIRVTGISPGVVRTEFLANYLGDSDEAAQAYEDFVPLDPEDVADAVLYALGAPQHVQIHDVLMRPTQQAT